MMKFDNFCSACLATNVKMHSSSTFNEELLQFLRFPCSPNDKETRFCYECNALVRKFEGFRRKCERAQEILIILRQNHREISEIHLQNVDRIHNNLASSIIKTECVTVTHTDRPLITDIPLPKLVKIKPRSINSKPNSLEQDKSTLVNSKPSLQKNKASLEKNNLINGTHIELVKNEVNEQELNADEQVSIDDGNCDFDLSDGTSENSADESQEKTTVKKENVKKRSNRYIIENLSDDDDDPFSYEVSKMMEEFQENIENRPKRTKDFKIEFFEQYMTVEFLTPEDAKRELLLRKESSNYLNCPFKCNICYKGYETEVAMNNHMKTHNKENGEFKCELCQVWFSKRRQHGAHVLGWHKRKFTCKLCPYICYCADKARAHIVNIHKDKNYPCKECKAVFSSPAGLLSHSRARHVTEHACDRCGDSLATSLELTAHYSEAHALDEDEAKHGPTCEDCEIQFASDAAYKRHLAVSPKHDRSKGCKHCGQLFFTCEEFKDHMIIHAKKPQVKRDAIEVPTICIYCAEYLGTLAQYEAHMCAAHPDTEVARRLRGADEKRFVCEVCGRAFKKQCLLQHHQYAHSAARRYACGHCDASFRTHARLYAHRAAAHPRLHPERPAAWRAYEHAPRDRRAAHACTVCGRTFSFRSGLYRHVKSHSARPFSCGTCGKSFVYQCEVRQHIKYVHVEGWPKRNRTRRKQQALQ